MYKTFVIVLIIVIIPSVPQRNRNPKAHFTDHSC